ncbi:MFS transporter [Amorphus sp. 3PC139-8]|uniref:MFS transporter n=1 Tax=Amorphus sp. 3PC139-8 TaxID=2735676 RepID=UPI00345CC24A
MPLFLRVFLPFSIGYLLSFLIRVINAVAGEPIAEEFALSPGELGLLTSLFFLAFACTQLPNGILIDRFGPRRVQGTLLLVAGTGTLLFATAGSFWWLGVGRLLMGFGTATCLTASFAAYRLWFGPDRLPMINGLHMSVGGIGAFIGGAPTEALITAFGWRSIFFVLGIGLFVLAFVTLFVVPRHDTAAAPAPTRVLLRELRSILVSRPFWRLCPLSTAVQAISLSVSGLWAGPWLRDAAGVAPATAAIWLSVIGIALMLGFLSFGWLGQRAARRGVSIERVFVLGCFGFLVVQILMIVVPPTLTAPLWLLYVFFGSVGVLAFVVGSSSFSPSAAGRLNTALNFFVFVAAFLVQWLFGELLDFFPADHGGASAAGYRTAFAILCAIQALSFIPILVIRRPETQGS